MRFCTYCDAALWPDPPEEMVVKGTNAYCNESHYKRQRYENRRQYDDELRWTHDCDECGQPMFTPSGESDWWCPDCDRGEVLDSSYWNWYKEEHYGGHEFDRDCPDCGGRLWLFDGALVCHTDDCDAYITQYGREWWAMFEAEYPSKTRSEQAELTEADSS